MSVIVGSILIVMGVIFPQSLGQDSLNKGIKAFRDANYKSAIEYFKQALDLDPTLVNAQIYLATAYLQQYMPGSQSRENLEFAEKAIEGFNRVLRQHPDNLNAVLALASIYQSTKHLQNARENYLLASQLDPQNPVPFYALGQLDWMMVSQKDEPLPFVEQSRLIEEGLESLDKALAVNPRYEDAMTYKSLLLREKARLALDPAEKARLLGMAGDWLNKASEARSRNRRPSPPSTPR
jgi:tetratricopeptide (TPR) repeat protein